MPICNSILHRLWTWHWPYLAVDFGIWPQILHIVTYFIPFWSGNKIKPIWLRSGKLNSKLDDSVSTLSSVYHTNAPHSSLVVSLSTFLRQHFIHKSTTRQLSHLQPGNQNILISVQPITCHLLDSKLKSCRLVGLVL